MKKELNEKSKIKNSSKLFFSGVLILTISNLIIKAIGLMFKIPMNEKIGDEGAGYYNTAYTIYTYLYMVSTAGLPTAISIIISDSRARGQIKQVKRILRIAVWLFVIIGIIGMSIMLIGAQPMSKAIGAENTKYAMYAIAPTLFLICVSSALRGYFQGYQQMVPTAISQLIEAVCKLGVGLAFAEYAIRQNYPIYIVAAYAAVGLTVGEGLGMVYLVFSKLLFKEHNYDAEFLEGKLEDDTVSPTMEILKKMIVIALPIAISASVMSLTNLIDMFLVMNRLQSAAGFSEMMANKLYGAYNMSVTLYNLPQTFVVAISVSIIPAISTYIAKNNRIKTAETIGSAFRLASMIAFPAGIGFLILSKPILDLLYYSRPEDVVIAAPLLSYLGIAVMFIALVSLSNSVLQAIGKINVPVFTMLIGGVVKIAANYILVGNPDININGAPIGTMCCYGIIAVLNLIVIKRHYKEISIVKMFGKTFISAVIMGIFGYLVSQPVSSFMGAKAGIILTIGGCMVIYFLTLLAIGGFTREDILMLPKGEKIAKLLRIK